MVAKRPHSTKITNARIELSLDAFLAAALRYPSRIAILRELLLQQSGLSYRELTTQLAPVTAEAITRHLRMLRRIGAIVPSVEKNSGRVVYLLADTPYSLTLRAVLDASSSAGVRAPDLTAWPEMDLLRELIAAIPDAVVVVARDGSFVLVNSLAENLWGGRPPRSIEAEKHSDGSSFYGPDGTLLRFADMPIPRALAGDTIMGQEIRYERSDGTRLDLLLNAAPIYASSFPSRKILAAVCIFQDISRLRALERQRDDFLSIAAHELRTPLTSVLGTVQVLLRQIRRISDDKPLDLANLRRGLERVNDQSQRIHKLILDLLDTSRIQSGQLEFNIQLVDLAAIVRDSVDGQSVTHPWRQIKCTVLTAPLLVLGDDVRLSQVVDNLLTNALKYSSENAPVEVTVDARGDEARLSVRDHGDGIPAEAMPRLFERFYRVPGMEVKSDSSVGLGLGLYISSTIVARHNGRIEVTAEPGKGTTFDVFIPMTEHS